MCGIVGFTYGSRLSSGLSENALTPLLNAMLLRGPDGEGRYVEPGLAMGMRRLAVIDTALGGQPMLSRNGQVVAFQNGEIYNFRKLRAELEAKGYAFTTQSDTEVIAHGYTEYGIDGLLARLDGMFAIAILDRDQNVVHVARDRTGEKPLFFHHSPGRAFAYASSLDLVAALPWIEDCPDPIALDRYLMLHFTPGDRTILRGVRKVLPGERLSVRLDDLSLDRSRYWRPELGRSRAISEEALLELVEQSVVSRMESDVPLGVFLSGGLDSAIVAAVAARRHPGIDTFSMGFDDAATDESEDALCVARSIGSRHHAFRFDQSHFLDLMPAVANALDEPIGDQALLPLYWLAREARQHVTVVLSGEGADEAFGGYDYYQPALRNRARGIAVSALIDDAEASTQSGFPILTQARERRQMLSVVADWDDDESDRNTVQWLNGASDGLQRAQACDIATWLPDDLLTKFDRMAMANSLEGRAPFLSPDLIQAGLDLPAHLKMTPDTSKVLLRSAAQNLLPSSILHKRKQGFVLPIRTWLGQWFDVHSGPAAYFTAHEVPGIDPNVAARLVTHDAATGYGRERLIFALIMLHLWRSKFDRRRRNLRASLMAAS